MHVVLAHNRVVFIQRSASAVLLVSSPSSSSTRVNNLIPSPRQYRIPHVKAHTLIL
ncbi:hypothetical protein PF003_g13580 [Phytophthora fragariae]|nr:hypothetical protein PF003_g13580 [Phytophthora fragariae]